MINPGAILRLIFSFRTLIWPSRVIAVEKLNWGGDNDITSVLAVIYHKQTQALMVWSQCKIDQKFGDNAQILSEITQYARENKLTPVLPRKEFNLQKRFTEAATIFKHNGPALCKPICRTRKRRICQWWSFLVAVSNVRVAFIRQVRSTPQQSTSLQLGNATDVQRLLLSRFQRTTK